MNGKESTIQCVVDRIEEDKFVVIELPDLNIIQIEKKFMPEEINEGNVIDITFKLNPEAEKEKRAEIKKLQEELLNRSKNM
jgi:hypothetical protein